MFLGLVLSVTLMCASEFSVPQFKEAFMKNAFLQTSNAGLGGTLTCEIGTDKKPKTYHNAKIESKALSLITDSIIQTRTRHIREVEKIPHIKELATLAKDSTLAKVYLMQLAKVDYHNPCLTCLRVAEEQIGFILSSMPSKINDREVRGVMD